MAESPSISAAESILQAVPSAQLSNHALSQKSDSQSLVMLGEGAVASGARKRSDSASHKVIEKRRRDRINKCLTELSKLIPAAYVKQQGTGKLEKAEILEMTVDHLRSLQQAGVSKKEESLMQEASPEMLMKYRSGFSECASEVAKFLSSVEGIDTSDPRFVRLLNHLQAYGNRENVLLQSMANASAREKRPIAEGVNPSEVAMTMPIATAATAFPPSTIPPGSFAVAAQMAALQQSFFQQQLAASAALQQSAEQNQRQGHGAPSLQHAQAQAAAAAAAMQIPAYNPYAAAAAAAASPAAAALFPLAAAAALNPRIALQNHALFAGLLSPASVCSLSGMSPAMMPTSSASAGVVSSSIPTAVVGSVAAATVDIASEDANSAAVLNSEQGDAEKVGVLPGVDSLASEPDDGKAFDDDGESDVSFDHGEAENEDIEPPAKKRATESEDAAEEFDGEQ